MLFLDGVKGRDDTTTELQGLHAIFDLRFNLFLLILGFVVLP